MKLASLLALTLLTGCSTLAGRQGDVRGEEVRYSSGGVELVVYPEETFFLRHVHQNPDAPGEETAAWLRDVALRYLGLGRAEGDFGNVDYRQFDHEDFIARYDRAAAGRRSIRVSSRSRGSPRPSRATRSVVATAAS